MIYKFDILLKKTLKTGGIKQVTYSSLLENPQIFGKDEGFGDAEGELSMVLEGPEEGFSINALYRKYRSQFLGKRNADIVGKDFPLQFVFANADDPFSIKMVLHTDDANAIAMDADGFELVVVKDCDCTISCEGTLIRLKRGQSVFVSTLATQLIFEPVDATFLRIK